MKAPLNLALLSRVLSQPWALREQTLVSLTQRLLMEGSPAVTAPVPERKRALAGVTPLSFEGWMAVEADTLPPMPENVTTLLVWGVLGRAWSASEQYWLDAIEVDQLTAAIAATPEGSTVVLWFRSPGGIVTGIPEAAEAIRTLGETRKIVSFTDDLCASAAYWLAAQTSRIVATPTADVGSIGVYLAYYDYCGYLEQRGVKLELFKAGELKGTGLMGNPLDDQARAHLQAGVLESYRAFTKDVTAQRDIASEHMQGQTLSGKAAKAANLVDGFRASASEFFVALGKGRI